MEKIGKLTLILLVFTLVFTACGQASKEEAVTYGILAQGDPMEFLSGLIPR